MSRTVGEIIREQREFMGMTREQLAEKAGVSAATLRTIETRPVDPGFTTVVALLLPLEMTCDDLIDWMLT